MASGKSGWFTTQWLDGALVAFASAFVFYGLFFYASQQALLEKITAEKLATAATYADSVGRVKPSASRPGRLP